MGSDLVNRLQQQQQEQSCFQEAKVPISMKFSSAELQLHTGRDCGPGLGLSALHGIKDLKDESQPELTWERQSRAWDPSCSDQELPPLRQPLHGI